MHVVHAVHDFLPRHVAGSELYVLHLAQAQLARGHHVTVVCAEFDPARPHASVAWRVEQGVPVVEIVNNWRCDTFADTYQPPRITARLGELLDVLGPDVLHVHNLLNLSFDLPAAARHRGVPVVATLHDYTLVCASGGQRWHRQENHVCHDIDTTRCARCFAASPFQAQVAVGRTAARPARALAYAAATARRVVPGLAQRAADAMATVGGMRPAPADLTVRLAHARRVFDDVALWVAPSAALADEFARLGLPRERLTVADYGMRRLPPRPRHPAGRPLRLGFVGTLAWHKGAHVLLDALAGLPPDGWRLDVFGAETTFPSYVAELRRAAAGLPVTFRGGFTAASAADVYAALDVLVVPSLWPENSPLVIHEAFQAGVAVVGSRTGGIPGLLHDGACGLLVEPGSVPDLTRALRTLVEDPSRVDALVAAAPTVRSIEDDAAEWDARYAGVGAGRAVTPA